MNGQYLGGRPITLSYSYKKDGQKGERHGSAAERKLASLGKKNNVLVTGFLPSPALATLATMPALPLPQGFSQASSAPGAGVAGGPPSGPPVAEQFGPPPPAPPGFANAPSGQGPAFGPPPGMPPPPAGFNQFGR
jgi:splicing factor 3B subunit 4